MNANRQVGLGQPQISLGTKAHITKQVGRIRAISQLAAHNQVETDRKAGKITGATAAAQQNDLVELEPQILQQLLGLVQGQLAGLQILL